MPVLLGMTLVLAALTFISAAGSLVAIPEMLQPKVRSTRLSVVYAPGVALFGLSIQVVITWLIKLTDNPGAPVWYVIGKGQVSLLAIQAPPESRH